MVFCCLPDEILLRIPGMWRVSLQLSDSPESLFFIELQNFCSLCQKRFDTLARTAFKKKKLYL
jgi:hypothetical protein